eukprot:gene7153-11466_t
MHTQQQQQQYVQMNEDIQIESKPQQTNTFFEEQTVDQKSLLNTIFEKNDACMVKQHTDLVELLTGVEIPNKYNILMSNGETLQVQETSEPLERVLCGAARGLVFNIYANNQKILSLEKPSTIFLPVMYVFDETQQPKRYIGKIQTQCRFFTREYKLINSIGQELSNITGNIFNPWNFFVHKNRIEIGKVQKKFCGFMKEFLTNSDNFGVQFQKDLSVDEKCLIFSATLLLDMTHFERNKN